MIEDAVRYANDCTLRGQPIGRFQMIQSDIAEMATAIEAGLARPWGQELARPSAGFPDMLICDDWTNRGGVRS